MGFSRNVILVGPMGAGKSTIGRQLASLLRYEFVDTDQEIEDRTGADIPWIFDVEGEEGFRRREESVLEDLTRRQHVVIATGGGAITREANRLNMKARGSVVYLKTSIEQQLQRTSRDRNRPLLQTGNPREVLTRLMGIRAPLYESIADITVDTDQSGVRDVATRIVELLNAD
jgi:shikimate kinase